MCGRKETTYFLCCLETKRQRESQQFLIDFVKPRNAVKGFFMIQTSPYYALKAYEMSLYTYYAVFDGLGGTLHCSKIEQNKVP